MLRPLRSPWPVATRIVAVLLAAGALAACDSAPGLPAADARPSVTAFALTPVTDSLGTDARTADVPLQLTLTLVGTGPIRVRALVRYAGTDTLVAVVTATAAPGPVTLDVPIVVPRGAIGDYSVTVATEGPDRRAGDGASGVFRFRASSLGPPAVAGVTAPASITAPTRQGNTAQLTVVVAATDPDGRENLAVVVLEQPGVGVIGQLSDRGRGDGSGDATAGDGRYSGALLIPFGFPPDTYTLNAIAIDRSGQASEPVSFTFTVQ